jgi:hypothetical protein
LRRLCIAVLLALLAAPASAAGQHNQLDWISTGPTGGNGPGDTCAACGIGFADDAGRVAFTTAAALVPSDTDTQTDVYLNDGGAVTKVSTGPTGGNGAFPARYTAATPDLSKIYFGTTEALVGTDADGQWDLYEWSNGVTTLVSTGPAGGNGTYDVCLNGGCLSEQGAVSDDGSHVFFETRERLTFDDIDSSDDVYERTNGTTRLVSTGSGNSFVDFLAASGDGSTVFFRTLGAGASLYKRANGTDTQIPTGNRGFGFDAATRDGSRVFFTTRDSLVASDQDDNTCVVEQGSPELFPDSCNDIYQYSNGTITLVSAKPDGTGAALL